VLFSQPDVVRILNERFECAWESVRPVPKVAIDFGDGRTLERTLFGNVATYVTLADGRAIDVVPGLVDPVEYQRRLEAAERLHFYAAGILGRQSGPFGPDPATHALAEDFVRAYHADVDVWEPADPRAKLTELERAQMRADLSKVRVEQPIKDWLRGLHVERLRRSEADERRYAPDDSSAHGPADHLLEDTAYNVRERYPKARALLAGAPRLATPAELTTRLYREVLDVDLDDPYLGLAPYVLGGEAGRH
jgi:hypothetical protein